MPNRFLRTTTISCLTAILLIGCSDETDETNDPSQTNDTAEGDSGNDALDAQQNEPLDHSCADLAILDTTILLDPEGPLTQIHPNTAYDGEGIWVVYGRPEESGNFDIYATRIGCDGTTLVTPFLVNTTEGGNDIEPRVATADGNLYVVWTTDRTEQQPTNLDFFYRVFTVDGTPVMESDRTLETMRGGVSVDGNLMAPAIAAIPGAGFVIAGSRGLDEAGRFQIFFQRIDSDGMLVGEAVDGFFEAEITQMDAELAVANDGSIYLGWTRSTDSGGDQPVHTRFAPGATEGNPSPPHFALLDEPGSQIDFAADRESGHVILARDLQSTGNASILIADGSTFDTEVEVLTLGENGSLDFSPRVAVGDSLDAVLWYRNLGGLRNQVIVQGVRLEDNGTWVSGNEVDLGTALAGPYEASITHVGGDVFFAVWAEGPNPDFTTNGRFVSLSGDMDE